MRPTIAALIFLMLTGTVAQTDDFFGPKTYTVDENRLKLTESFNASNNADATLVVINGFEGKRARAVKIFVNGKRYVKRRQVNSGVRSYSVNLQLEKRNEIKIIVKGNDASVQIALRKGATRLLDRVVAIGDSLTAGMQDATLEEPRQVWCYPAQIANSAGFNMPLPLISEPGIPARQFDLINGELAILDPQEPGIRVNPDEQPYNLAVPGADISDILQTSSSDTAPLFEAVLGGRDSAVEQARKLEPGLILLWTGNNDVMGMVFDTDPENHTPIEEFSRDYETLLEELTATGARIVALNIPDITLIPFLVAPPELLGLPTTHRITLYTFLDLLQGNIPVLGPDDVLTPEELSTIRKTVMDFNDEVARLCSAYDIPLIDAFTLFGELHEHGVTIAGTTITTELLGGIFSLDGVHPGNTGQAIVANRVIEKLNEIFDTEIDLVDLELVYMEDPLQGVTESVTPLAQRLHSMSPDSITTWQRALERLMQMSRGRR